MTAEETLFNSIGTQLEGAVAGNLFGKSCFKINGKAFLCFFQNEMVFKLTKETHADALSLDGAQLFDPSGKGRPMKEWVQVPGVYSDQWPAFAQAALVYVG